MPHLPGESLRFELGGRVPIRVAPMQGDASTRRYFRAFFEGGGTCVIMIQPHAGLYEEEAFLVTRRFLDDRGLPVPRLYFHDPARSVVALEDLGDTLLEETALEGDPRILRKWYTDAIQLLIRLKKAGENPVGGVPAFDLAFDMTKYMWEMDFFFTHFVRGLCGNTREEDAITEIRKGLAEVCAVLEQEPRIFVHRDFHSRNLLIHNGELFIIDFQDARMGPPQYDLCSLLRDSYVTLPEELSDEMIEMYAMETGMADSRSMDRFREIFDLMSLQRNIKALGTFGFQVGVKGAQRYESAIGRTGRRIAENPAVNRKGNQFSSLVEQFITGPAASWEAVEGRALPDPVS
jgi:N-acetylmuramate 1-kinase